MKLHWVKTNENNQIMKIPFTHNLTLDTQRVNQTPPYSKILTTKPYTPQPLIPKLYILHNNILPSQTSWYLNKILYTTISLLDLLSTQLKPFFTGISLSTKTSLPTYFQIYKYFSTQTSSYLHKPIYQYRTHISMHFSEDNSLPTLTFFYRHIITSPHISQLY